MNLYVCVWLAITAYIANAVPMLQPDIPEYKRFIVFSDIENEVREIDLEAPPNMDLVDQMNSRDTAFDNVYLLYTRRNPSEPEVLEMYNTDSIINSNFNPELPTVFVVHGWLGNRYLIPNPNVRDVYLEMSDVNIIVVEWRRVAALDYTTSVLMVPGVGRDLGEFINVLYSVTGAPYSTMHLVGFSLGAHVAGCAGRVTNQLVQRITGLDPSGPLWLANSNRLAAEDAVYVEVIHTDGSISPDSNGIGIAIGQTDFFPNAGYSQPGCLTNTCSHHRAVQLFAATVKYDHLIGRGCTNVLQVTLNTCRGDSLNMGNSNLNKSGSGMYRLDTGMLYPY